MRNSAFCSAQGHARSKALLRLATKHTTNRLKPTIVKHEQTHEPKERSFAAPPQKNGLKVNDVNGGARDR